MSCIRGCCATQADHYRSVVVRPTVTAKTLAEARLQRDLDAYQRMRSTGQKPPTFAGAADLERNAVAEFEVSTGKILGDDRLARHVDRAVKDIPPDAA